MRADRAEAYQSAHARREVGTGQCASFALRPATMADAELLLEWRNDPETRSQSFSTDEVDIDGHRAWLASKLGTARFYVTEVNGVPVGQVRIDGDVLSFSVASEHRRQGYGTRIIRSVMDQPLIAMVKPDNVGSRKVFERLGWHKARATADQIVYTFE